MIKSIHKLLVPAREADFRALADFFAALGLGRGESWQGRRSKGVKFDAPEAGVEIGMGQGFPDADLVLECDSADVLYELAQHRRVEIVREIADQDWGARMFTLKLPAGAGRLAVFSYNQDWRTSNLEGRLSSLGKRFGIVVSRFNAFITERLLAGAIDALRRTGARLEDVKVVRVPGAFEVPGAARTLAASGTVDAVICIACIIRGETSHYEHIATEVTRGIGQSAQETGVPHAYGVLTCENLEQAIDRAGLKAGNKGYEAALAAVEMSGVKQEISQAPGSGRRALAKAAAVVRPPAAKRQDSRRKPVRPKGGRRK